MIRKEERDIPVRKIQWLGVSLIAMLILIGILLLAYQKHLVKGFNQIESFPSVTPRSQGEFESGRIREQLQSEEIRNLQTYQNLNASEAWVQVPVERAMDYVINKKSTDPRLLFPQSSGGFK